MNQDCACIRFANTRDHAIVAKIVSLAQEDPSRTNARLGRTVIQKLCYFAKAGGVPISFSFDMLRYGPYSHDLAMAIQSMQAEDILQDRSSRPEKYSDYCICSCAHTLFEYYAEDLSSYERQLSEIVNLYSGQQSDGLELLSTLHFAYQEEKSSHPDDVTKDAVVTRFSQLKPRKFKPTVISRVYDTMRELRLLD